MQSHSSNDCRVRGLFYSLIFDMYKGPFSKGCDHPFIKGVQIYELTQVWEMDEGLWFSIEMIQVMLLSANPRVFFSFVQIKL